MQFCLTTLKMFTVEDAKI